jgi:UDPglucose 6-dehydrogenase
LLSSVLASNDQHKLWVQRAFLQRFGDDLTLAVAVWGLTYKPGTDTLRRSLAVELCDWLLTKGARLRVYDPVAKNLPSRWDGKVTACETASDAAKGVEVLVVGTDWPEFKQAALWLPHKSNHRMLIIDANRHLQAEISKDTFDYVAVGSANYYRPT